MALSAKSTFKAGVVESVNEDTPPEILAAIAAAATVFLGRRFRLLSVSPSDKVSRWTRQGRATVQASHNLRKKR